MSNLKSFNQIVSQPTVRDGSLKQGLSLTRLAESNLNVSLNGSVTVQGKELQLGAIVASALLPAYDNKFSATLDDLLSLYSEGYVSELQRSIANAVVVEGKKIPLTAGSVLTAEEYLKGHLRVAKIDAGQLYSSITDLLATKPTAAQLTSFIVELQASILSDDTLSIYNEKLRKEKELKEQFIVLDNLGFTDIAQVKENVYSAKVPLTHADNLSQLAPLGYVLIDTKVDIASSTFTIIFNKQA